ncbi:MAG TPA: endonuclease/exonuclease/phosphatase family protein [Blastocatellia bacterium]|nr:endonuclease/exonuclease/phosphatase family protein [Blastocatellia bacterium]
MRQIERFRAVTYNIHKCKGLDQRVKPQRIVDVLREIDADVIALQEVLCIQGAGSEDDQAHFIGRELGFDFRLGENRKLRGGAYGNVVLSRFPFTSTCNYDISVHGREARGCMRVDLDLHRGNLLHIYNVHLGTSYFERRHQARKLLNDEILKRNDHTGPRIMLGDFNEWTSGLASRLLTDHFQSADIRLHLGRARTYPGVLPFLHLDHIYFDDHLELMNAIWHRSRAALMASDHLPVVADFRIKPDFSAGN